jgi:hypothetical protein
MPNTNRLLSGFAVMDAVSTLQQTRERLLALCPDIEQDEQLFSDMLEGEAGDALGVIERLVDASIAADDLADLTKARLADLTQRKARFERRRDAYRTVALEALEAIGVKKLERPHFTAWIRHQQAPLLIDEAWLPSEWWKTKREPMRGEIRDALDAGQEIPGAQFGNAGTGLSIRTK